MAVTRQAPAKGKGTELPAWRNGRHPCRLAGNGVRRALGAAGGIVGISDQDDGVVMTRWLRVRRRVLHSRTCAPVSWRQLNAWQAHETRASVEAESRQRTFDGAMTAPASTLWKDLFLALLEAAGRAHRAIPWQVARTAHVARGQVVIVAESAAR